MVDYYGVNFIYQIGTFFKFMDTFWCSDDVQGTLKNGTFQDSYVSRRR